MLSKVPWCDSCRKKPQYVSPEWTPAVCGECSKRLCKDCISPTIKRKFDADCCRSCAKEQYGIEEEDEAQ